MAAVALKKLEDQLSCLVCLDAYTNPKVLQCNHVYCQRCLAKLVVRDQRGRLILTCPSCRQVTPVPASGVAGLQPAFHVNQLLEIVEEHKKAEDASVRLEKAVSASVSPTPVCSEHDGKEIVLYCETCEETICWKCIKKGEKHHSHNYEELDEAFERYKEEMTSSLEPLEKQLAIIEEALKVFDARYVEISDQRGTIEIDIFNTITQLQARINQTLEVRKTELISQLDRLTSAKLKSLEVQRDQIETTQAQLSSCLFFVKENLKTGNQKKALMMKSTSVRQIKELTTTFQPDVLEPSAKADLIFSALEDLTLAECQKFGKVTTPQVPDVKPHTRFKLSSGRKTHRRMVYQEEIAHKPQSADSEECSTMKQLVASMEAEQRKLKGELFLAEESLRECEKKLHQLETQWVVEKREIQLTGPELGRGAWSTVSVATFRGALVAAKCMHNHIISRYSVSLIQREMSIAARIRHPNLVQFIGATQRGELTILTELMPTSLRKELESKPQHDLMPLQQVTSIGADVARALNYLHLMQPHPLVHRDISSANVLLQPLPDASWRAKVSDYATVNFLIQLQTAGPGSPTYAAPEANDPNEQSPKMDIFSFGVLMVEMLTGEFPDPDERARQLFKISRHPFLHLIQRCLSRKKENRPSAGDIITELTASPRPSLLQSMLQNLWGKHI